MKSKNKVELFNILFAKQCTLIDNTSEIPITLNIKATKTLSSIPVTRVDIAKIIKIFDPNKAHEHDIISIRVLKLYGDSVLRPIELLKRERFPQDEKKSKCSFGVQKMVISNLQKIIAPYIITPYMCKNN